MQIHGYHKMAADLLKDLIEIPSVSRDEKAAGDRIESFFLDRGMDPERKDNNIWVRHEVSAKLPTILLNSHIDTVKPVAGWTKDPWSAVMEGSRMYGLGSNDAGAPLVSLIATFLYLTEQSDLPYNLVFAASAEEEVSGDKGISSILGDLGDIHLGIVGEPTGCRMAVAEKGLMVLDCEAQGISAHAATGDGTNAIYQAMADMQWFRDYHFEKQSKWLGEVMMQVTQVEAGTQHNVVPDTCRFIVDVRTTDCYDNESVFRYIKENVSCRVKARSFRLNPSSIDEAHPVVKKGMGMGLEAYGSMTLSDQALMPFTTLKIGPGDWQRSHTADEYITTGEIEQGINTYIQLLEDLELLKEIR